MPERNWTASGAETYRYAYNGMEQDNEVSGNGNSYTTEFRQYDPRLGRWKSLDPLMAKYPDMSPYTAFNNNPVFFVDPQGLEGVNNSKPKPFRKRKHRWTNLGGNLKNAFVKIGTFFGNIGRGFK
ncbi:MAG: hypothetical protein NXI10_15250, partial [bacterium]|nr:hypothetical protein [bacterium]